MEFLYLTCLPNNARGANKNKERRVTGSWFHYDSKVIHRKDSITLQGALLSLFFFFSVESVEIYNGILFESTLQKNNCSIFYECRIYRSVNSFLIKRRLLCFAEKLETKNKQNAVKYVISIFYSLPLKQALT